MKRRSIPLFIAFSAALVGSSLAQTKEPLQRVGLLSVTTQRTDSRPDRDAAVSPSLREAVRPTAEAQAEWKPYRLSEEQRLLLRSQLRGESAAQAAAKE